MSEQIRKPLPESLMKAIRATVESPEATPQEKFDAVVLMTNGYGLWSAQTGRIDPTRYAIPEEQWNAIGEMLQTTVPESGAVTRVNVVLGWMNIGPSAYKPEGN